MELQQLKEDINNNNLRDSFFIFKGDKFLADQYSKRIAKILNLNVSYIESIDSYITPQTSLFSSEEGLNSNSLNVCKCPELTTTSNKLNFGHGVKIEIPFIMTKNGI